VRAGNLLFVSGQLAMRDGQLVGDDIETQTRVTLENLDAVLTEHGANRAQVVKTLVLLSDMKDWAAMNRPYVEFFGEALPARSAFGVELIAGALVEIEAVAYLGD
jgi:2-iminobutanoate/2-iminopropanoate deaminase